MCSCLVCRGGGAAGESPVVTGALQQADQTSCQQQPAGHYLHPGVSGTADQRGEERHTHISTYVVVMEAYSINLR